MGKLAGKLNEYIYISRLMMDEEENFFSKELSGIHVWDNKYVEGEKYFEGICG